MAFRDKFKSAINGWRVGGYSPEDIELMQKAAMEQSYDLQKGEAAHQMKALLEDPFGVMQAMQYKDRPFSLSYDLLRRMATKDAVVAAIITTRVNQVSTFTVPARFTRSGIGFEIRLRDISKKPSKTQIKNIMDIEKFLENTGYHNDNGTDDFDAFVRKIVRDRLTYDQVCFEVVPDRLGRPAEFCAVDASTIRIASDNSRKDAMNEYGYNRKEADKVKYVQVIQGEIQAYFTGEELAFGVSNPRTDIQLSGYGFSELEMLIQQITAHLWAEEYNSRFFSQGGTTKGILNLKGNAGAPIQAHQMEAFKRQWISQVSGMTGAWKTPVVSVDGIEYINVSQTNREMEFEKWMNYLINIGCAVFQIDPAEVNFPNRGGAGGSGGGGLGDGGIEDRLKHSKDKGLGPLLRFIETLINKYIVSRFGEDYVFAFVGYDKQSESEIVELQGKRVRTYKTLNEVRADEGLDPLENGDIILDPNFITHLNNIETNKMQQQQMEQQDQQTGEQNQQPDASGAEGAPAEGGDANEPGNFDGDKEQTPNTDKQLDFGKSLTKGKYLEIQILD